jgi:hypothetical protein
VLGGFGDPLQGVFGIALRIGDGTQDFRAGTLALPCQRQLPPQVRVLDLEFDLASFRLVALGAGGFEARLDVGDGCFQLIDRDRHVLWKRRHSIHTRTRAGPIWRLAAVRGGLFHSGSVWASAHGGPGAAFLCIQRADITLIA